MIGYVPTKRNKQAGIVVQLTGFIGKFVRFQEKCSKLADYIVKFVLFVAESVKLVDYIVKPTYKSLLFVL